jgi:hypothetical protein
MKKQMTLFLTAILILSILIFLLPGCGESNSPFHTFTMQNGLANFSFEYNSSFRVKESYTVPQISAVTIEQRKGNARILIGVAPPDSVVPNAKASIIRAENNAASWKGYKLLGESELLVDNVQAYRFDSEQKDIGGILSGASPTATVIYREVRFDAKGFGWMIQMESPTSSTTADEADFTHILQTFKILN